MWSEVLSLMWPALVFVVALMSIVWWLAMRIGNAGIVDIAWSAGFAPVAILYALCGTGALPRRILIALMVSLWSLRLGAYLYVRVMSHHPLEDRRYARLRQEWGSQAGPRMFGFFQLQALLLLLLSAPVLLACLNPAPGLGPLEWSGSALWFAALVGEGSADRQLQRFKADPARRGTVCDMGLWRYSRHPNYFFEWLIWVAYFLFALGSPGGWITLYCPLLMLFFLLRVTGIPMTEQLSLETKGAAFADYQRRTSAFIPWFPKQP